jgi:protein pelota
MKILSKSMNKDGSGSVTLLAQESEDLWPIYQLIAEGDRVISSTVRRVLKESSSGTVDSERKKLTLEIEVNKIEYNPGAEVLRLSGRNVTENRYVKMGAHHTFDLDINRKFTLTKGDWDSVSLETLEQACDPSLSAEVGAVVMEEGLANLCLITKSMTLTRQRVELSIPGKRKGMASAHDRAVLRFYQATMDAMERHFNFDVLKAVIVASPGFVKDAFFKFVIDEATRRDLKPFLENRAKFVLVHSSSGHKHSLVEVLENPEVAEQLSDTKAAEESQALEHFFKHLMDNTNRACYGPKHVARADEHNAIDTLLITDELFRAANLADRKRYVALVNSVRESGGRALIFSAQHISGADLQRHTGVAAILRFPMPELDDLSSSDDDDDDDDDDSYVIVASSSSSSSSTRK